MIMKLKLDENSTNYGAYFHTIKELRKHSNADRLQCTNIFGNNVIVGLDTKEGDSGLYFPLESQLSLEFATNNDLIRRKNSETGKTEGGMFDENRRVRAQTFRGEKSAGFWIPLDSLLYIPNLESIYVEGETFTHIGEHEICKKYIPVNTPGRNSGAGPKSRNPKVNRIIDNQFKFHFDTKQLGPNIHKLKLNDLISITWKLHGTSAIVSNCLVRSPLPKWKQIFNNGIYIKLDKKNYISIKPNWKFKSTKTNYDYVYGSRKVIKNDDLNRDYNHFYGYDLWSEVGKEKFEGKLHKGETIYYEIVGYKKNGGYIQGPFDYDCVDPIETIKKMDKELDELGKTSWNQQFSYYKVYVYRITQTNVDGVVTELQWNQVRTRCNELGVECCPEIFYGTINEYMNDNNLFNDMILSNGGTTDWQQIFLQNLQSKYVYDQNSQFCKNPVPEEGIVVRREGLNIESFKLKSFKFREFETKSMDKGEIDIETEQTQEENER